jgi:hypothetical protein
VELQNRKPRFDIAVVDSKSPAHLRQLGRVDPTGGGHAVDHRERGEGEE